MSQIFTTPSAESVAKAWLHDLTFAAGIRTTNQRTGYYAGLNFPQWFVEEAIINSVIFVFVMVIIIILTIINFLLIFYYKMQI